MNLRERAKQFGFAPSTISGWLANSGPPEPTRKMFEYIAALELEISQLKVRKSDLENCIRTLRSL